MSKNSTPINSLNQDFSEKSSDILANFNVDSSSQPVSPNPSEGSMGGNKKKILFILLTILAFVFLAAGFYIYSTGYFNGKNGSNILIKNPTSTDTQTPDNGNNNSSSEHINPINGMYLTDEVYNTIKDRKPVSAMLNNHPDARPQAGLNDADIIYEIVAEGGISRIMPVFYSKIPTRVGSMRSARIYFMQVAAEYNPIFMHWGVAYRPDYEKN